MTGDLRWDGLNDERVKCLRIFADGNGRNSHGGHRYNAASKKAFLRTIPAASLRKTFPASWYNVCYVPTGNGGSGLAQSAAEIACALANRRGRI